MADTLPKGARLAIGAAAGTGVAAIGLTAFLLTQTGPTTPAVAPETSNNAPAVLSTDSTTVQPAQFGQASPAAPPTPPATGADATAVSPDGAAISFSDESLSFSSSLPQGPANDPVLTYLRRDSQAYLNKMKTNARADYDRLKRTGAKPDAWEVRVKWAYTARAGDIVSLSGEASEYNGGAHPMQYFDTHIARTSGDQLKMSDMLLAKASPSPAITIAICEALKTAKKSHIKSATIFDEPIVCVGSSANAKTEEAKIALAPSNLPGKFGGLYVYYDPYVVGAYSEGGYRLTIQQEVFAEDLRPQFKTLFGGEAPALAN